jgi:hypothetical protein
MTPVQELMMYSSEKQEPSRCAVSHFAASPVYITAIGPLYRAMQGFLLLLLLPPVLLSHFPDL